MRSYFLGGLSLHVQGHSGCSAVPLWLQPFSFWVASFPLNGCNLPSSSTLPPRTLPQTGWHHTFPQYPYISFPFYNLRKPVPLSHHPTITTTHSFRFWLFQRGTTGAILSHIHTHTKGTPFQSYQKKMPLWRKPRSRMPCLLWHSIILHASVVTCVTFVTNFKNFSWTFQIPFLRYSL